MSSSGYESNNNTHNNSQFNPVVRLRESGIKNSSSNSSNIEVLSQKEEKKRKKERRKKKKKEEII